MLEKFAHFLNSIRCWTGKHTYPMYLKKFISIDPWCPEDGGYGYDGECYVCGKVKRVWVYDSQYDYLTDPRYRAQIMQDDFEKLAELKLTSEL